MEIESEEMNEDQEPVSSYGPLSFSNITKENFKIDDLTPENPFLLIPKEIIIEDIKNRSDESEFKRYEEDITKYSEDNLKLMLDVDKKYGEEYVLCLTPEATEIVVVEETENHLKLEAVAEKEEYEEETIDEQIETERDMDTRPKIEITVIHNEKVERRPLQFSSKLPSDNKNLYVEILPESEYYELEGEDDGKPLLETIYRKTRDWSYQESVYMKTGFSQTAKPSLANACAQTEIKLFSESEKDNIWKTPAMEEFVCTVEKRMFDTLVEISAGGLEKPWSSLHSRESEVASGRETHLTVTRSFICISGDETKMISSVEWHPILNDVFVVSTVQNLSFENQVKTLSRQLLEPCLLYMWSTEDHLLPRLILDSCDEVLCIKFNPTLPHLIIGGCSSGQLVLWDLSPQLHELERTVENNCTGHTSSYDISALGGNAEFLKSPTVQHCASSSIDQSHLLGTRCLEWIPAGMKILPKGDVKAVDSFESFQIATCGFDGFLRFWDLQFKEEGVVPIKSKFLPESIYQSLDLTWKPFYVVDIPPPEGQKRLCLTTFSLKLSKNAKTMFDMKEDEKQQISAVFFAGSEDGKVFWCDFRPIKDAAGNFEVRKPEYFTSVQSVHVHGGAIVGIYHSPFMDNVFCSIGGKTLAIWDEGLLKGPLVLVVNKTTIITTGHWSPTRPAVFMLGLHDGSLQIWDLLHSNHRPVLFQSVASAAITSITTRVFSGSKQILAIGDGDGFVHILNLPPYLWKPGDNELVSIKNYLEREVKRVEMQIKEQVIIDARKAAEAKKLEEERKRHEEKVPEPEPEEKEISEEDKEMKLIAENYKEFLELENKYLIELGYIIEETKINENVTDDGS